MSERLTPPSEQPEDSPTVVDIETYNTFRQLVESLKTVSQDEFEARGLDPFGKLLSEDPNVKLTPEESTAALSFIFGGAPSSDLSDDNLVLDRHEAESLVEEMMQQLELERPGILEESERRLKGAKRFEQELNEPKNNPETS